MPEVFSEGRIDWEKLKATLGEHINFSNERYVLNWAGKSDAFKILQTPTTKTLVPAKEESVNFDESQNIFIEGENLEVLKVLQKSYFGKVKMIYIDPPYNTGNDSFIYPDKFSESKADYEKRVGDKDEDGYMTKDGMFKKNSKENGQYHSNWLNMMMPRLYLAKNLLRQDGVMFVHIDNNEVHNLRMLLNEIFGEENFIECINWNKRVPKNDKGIGSIHEYVLIYVKDSSLKHEFLMAKEGLQEIEDLLSKIKKKKMPLNEGEDLIRKLYNKRGYDRGITLYNSLNSEYRLWGKINMSWPNANTFGPRYEVKHPKTGKPVKIPDRGWRWKEDSFNDAALIVDGKFTNVLELHDGSFLCGKIWFDKDENTQPSSINYLDELDNLLLRSIISLKSDGGIEVEKLFEGKSYFSYPKPTSLAKLLIKSVKNGQDDIILDFFAGSGTTAHAVMDLNKEDGGNRKYICVQLPELLEENSEALKAGFKNIAEVSKERIRKAAKAIEQELEVEKEKKKSQIQFETNVDTEIDLGFKSLVLSDSNFKQWKQIEGKDAKALAEQMKLFVDPVAEHATIENMVYELLLKSGKDLNSRIEKKDGYFLINGNEMALILEKVSQEIIDAVIAKKPVKVIALDKLFKGNDQLKTNTVLQMRDAGVEFKTI
ncbi:site-specific DNA-methyltransferase [Belliella kenyensis]|uniref:site-specific DNA-methyltransferase (adenine-specific) n=1 Tax=Belliella kenyensis TaxID=1472724 RepID=A0ABV8EM78_9BACT|nr:site-specific DNA-methyltransferase [Belliella kenyensis]MCH7400416.1 site-specific DNA-methyltransferase [Belliella kenyensis]MDN3604567.1 site-specific DNA-methyltransferase [Belliella kenyensis]